MSVILNNEFFTLYELDRGNETVSCQFEVKPDFEKYRGLNSLIPIKELEIRSATYADFNSNQISFYAPGTDIKRDNKIIEVDSYLIDALLAGESIIPYQRKRSYQLIHNKYIKDFDKSGNFWESTLIEKAVCKEIATNRVVASNYDIIIYSDKEYQIPGWVDVEITKLKDGFLYLDFKEKDYIRVGWVLLYFRLLDKPDAFNLTTTQKEFFFNPDITKVNNMITSGTYNWIYALKYLLKA